MILGAWKWRPWWQIAACIMMIICTLYNGQEYFKHQLTNHYQQHGLRHSLQWYQPNYSSIGLPATNDKQQSACKPRRSVSFIKIHKTGSGAFHNLLLRLALRHNLTVALFLNGRNLVNKAPYENYHNYDIFVNHYHYNRDAWLKFMASDTVFVTQLRQPFAQAESAFYHFSAPAKYGVKNETNPFMAFLQTHQNESTSVAQNFQSHSLGYSTHSRYGNDSQRSDAFLQRIDSELYFVSVLELLDESSVLLKRKMCWHIQDVLRIHTHVTRNKKQAESELKKRSQTIHREMSKMDYQIYNFYKNKLLQEIQQEPDFDEELQQYKVLNSQLVGLCNRMCEDFDGVDGKNITGIRTLLKTGLNLPSTKFYTAFRLTYFDCLLLTSSENVIQRVKRLQQYPDACRNMSQIAEYRLTEEDCDFRKHVFPGYHIKYFKMRFLNKDTCLGNFYY